MGVRFVMFLFIVVGLIGLTDGLLEVVAHRRVVAGTGFEIRMVASDLGNRVGWLFITGALPLLCIPILVSRATLVLDYYNASPNERRRIDLAWCILSLPAMMVLMSFASPAECRAGLQCGKLFVLELIYFAYFGSLLIRHKPKQRQ